jgi:hypothetical protein
MTIFTVAFQALDATPHTHVYFYQRFYFLQMITNIPHEHVLLMSINCVPPEPKPCFPQVLGRHSPNVSTILLRLFLLQFFSKPIRMHQILPHKEELWKNCRKIVENCRKILRTLDRQRRQGRIVEEL